ncbi:MAG: metallophosphoesterase family protein [Clostridia bacterium]|nr:metallophosphoesterase family protein [Clostridia bacterium]
MKKHLLFTLFVALILSLLCLGVMADEVKITANEASDISSAINKANSGDTVFITLDSDIEITETISIAKAITVNIYFNGKQLNYTGSADSNGANAGIYMFHAGCALNLYGSNPLISYKDYTHYSDDIKPDMIGTSNLISIVHGKLNVKDAYLLASSNAWAINSPYTDYNDCEITVENSVLRCPEGSSRSAITISGQNNGSYVKARILKLDNCVVYGGFKGQNYNFNLTLGTEFTDVKFYDFYIKNDCWYDPWNSEIGPILMNPFEKAIPVTNCIFQRYDGTIDNITVYTETGKQNLKLFNCTFDSIVSGGKFVGDRGGDAYVFVITKQATCQEDGAMKVCKNGGSLYDDVIKKGEHTYIDASIAYNNGYMASGDIITECSLCKVAGIKESAIEPLFVIQGYSLNEDMDSICYGVKINTEMLDKLKKAKPELKLEFGMLAGNGETEVSIENGAIKTSSGFVAPCTNGEYSYIDLVINGFIDNTLKDKKFAMEFYVYDGEKLELGDGEMNYNSFNDVVYLLDEDTRKAVELLESKHKLQYNEDGSFRVLILADLHMSAGADSAKVQAVKDRVKFLVDKEKPNLVIFTGDNTIGSSSENSLRTNIDAMVSYIEEKQIPWCHVYGNHDHEGALSNEQQQAIYESYEYCISKDVDGISGTGNYVNAVYKADGTVGAVIYCLDSGAYDSVNGGYDYIKEDQIAWYKETSELLQKYNGGKVIPGMMAFHIPLIENNTAHDNRNNSEIVYEWDGQKNEAICASKTDTTLLETIFERGDIKAIVTGHDHVNDYMYNYLGVKLTNSPNISDLTYCNATVQGGRVFDLNYETVGTNIPTYVSYIIERVNPNDYEIIADGTVLEGFDGETPEITFRNYGGSALSGSATANIVDGKLEITRGQTGNFEFLVEFENMGRLGNNKYLIVWMDFTNVEFRKACAGFVSNGVIYRTDDTDTKTPFYYLADGTDEWTTLYHGGDGCFGAGDNGSQGMKGKKGYFAIPVEYISQSGAQMNANTLISGFYIYADIQSDSYANVPFYFDNIMLVENYSESKLPN